jgi:recombination protein RecT
MDKTTSRSTSRTRKKVVTSERTRMTTQSDYRPVAQQPEKKTLVALIEQLKPEIARALPRHLSPDRMARIATTTLRQNPNLARCTPESFLGALMTASQLGLEPGPLGEAWLVPYGNTCTFIPGYRGLIKLALQSPNVSKARARVVHENDTFDYAFGLEEHLDHTPAKGERGPVTHVYALVKYTDGGSDFDVMTVEDVEKVRTRSKAGKTGPWVTDWEAMAMKTVFKRLSKWLPLSPEVNLASAYDETVRTNVDTQLTDMTPDYIDVEETAEAAE